jgi:MoxR-like ATPase
VIQTDSDLRRFADTAEAMETEIGRVIVGQRDVVRHIIIAVIAGQHVLLEGVPGLGKTMLVRTLGQVLDLQFSRVQFTPDLMPADITGTNVIVEDAEGRRDFQFQAGPIFTNLLLADEINRATPKTQSALLEAMQEKTVTVARSTHRLPIPFFVMATQNPIEMEGTYPLPEAQLDRFFFKLDVGYPTADELMAILGRTTTLETPRAGQVADGAAILRMGDLARALPIATPVTDYAARLTMATHPDDAGAAKEVRAFVRFGASTRGAQALVLGAKIRAALDGRFNAAFDDVRQMALPALRHRIILNYEAEAEGMTADRVLTALLAHVPEAR